MSTADPDPRPDHDRETVRVELGPRSYDVVVGAGLVSEAGRLMAPLLAGRSAVVVTDRVVAGFISTRRSTPCGRRASRPPT